MPWPSKAVMIQAAKAKLAATPGLARTGAQSAPQIGPAKPLGGPAVMKVQAGATAPADSGLQLDRYVEGICGAICGAMDTWIRSATLSGVVVNGAVATGGTFTGPALQGPIQASGPMATDMEVKYTRAIAEAIGGSWLRWQSGLKVPGLPWYPSFVAVPMPVAPPTANVPTPLTALASPEEAALMAPTLELRMAQCLGPVRVQYGPALFGAIAQAFHSSFMTFKSMTLAKNVIGRGVVPAWAGPPALNAAPVVGGTATGAPGFLA